MFSSSKKRLAIKVFFLFVLALIVAFYLFPIFWMLITSFKNRLQAFQIPPVWVFLPSIKTYKNVMTESSIIRAYINSIVVTSISTFFSMLFGSMAAYGLTRLKIPRRDDLSFFILSTRMFPPIITVIPVYMLFRTMNILDTRLGLILVYISFNLGFVVWMMEGFISEIPVELEEAALIDGCSRLGIFKKIILPLVRPGLTATTIFCVIFSWNEYLFAVILTGKAARTMPVKAAATITDRGVNWGDLTAIAALISIPILIIGALVQKHLIRGLTVGALKQ